MLQQTYFLLIFFFFFSIEMLFFKLLTFLQLPLFWKMNAPPTVEDYSVLPFRMVVRVWQCYWC